MTDMHRTVLTAKGQRTAAALVRSKGLEALARLLAADPPFYSADGKLRTYRALADMLCGLLRISQEIQQEVSDGKHAAAHAAAQKAVKKAAAAAGPSSGSGSSSGTGRGGGGRAGDDGSLPELSADGKRSVLAEQVVAAVQRSGILEHLARAALRLLCGQAPEHPDSFSPALEAIALCDAKAEGKSALLHMQKAVLDALCVYTGVYFGLPTEIDSEGDAVGPSREPLGASAQWYLAAHVLAQVAASELHSVMLPYRLMAVERAAAPAAAAAARQPAAVVAAAASSAGPGQGPQGRVITSVRKWAKENGLESKAVELSGLLEATVLNLDLYGLDPTTALPRPALEGCSGCGSVACVSEAPMLRCSSIITTMRSWIRTAAEAEASVAVTLRANAEAAGRAGFQLLVAPAKVGLCQRIARTALERWADSAERARAASAAQGEAAAAGPSGSQPQAPAPEPKRTRPLTQRELRQQAAAAKKAQAQAPRKGGSGGGGSGAAATSSALERARKAAEEELRVLRERVWLLGGFRPERCPLLAVMALACSATVLGFGVTRHVQESADRLEEELRQELLQLQLQPEAPAPQAPPQQPGAAEAGGWTDASTCGAGGGAAAAAQGAAAGTGAGADGGAGAVVLSGSASEASGSPPKYCYRYSYDLAAGLAPPEAGAPSEAWWQTTLQCLRLLGTDASLGELPQGATGLGTFLNIALAGAGSPECEHLIRLRMRQMVGWAGPGDSEPDSDDHTSEDDEGSDGGSGPRSQGGAAAGVAAAGAKGSEGEGQGQGEGENGSESGSEGESESDSEADQVDAYLAAVRQASLSRGLKHGLVPALERLVRKFGSRWGPDDRELAPVVLRVLGSWDEIQQLLQQAPRQQATALVASLSKLAAHQWRAAVEAATAKSADGGLTSKGLQAAEDQMLAAMQLRLQAPGEALAGMLPVWGPEGGGADGAGDAAREAEQRAELLSLGLANWLPAAGQMLEPFDAAALSKLMALADDGDCRAVALSLRDLVLRALEWVQVLVQAAVLAEARGDALAAASWDALVLRGVNAWRLVTRSYQLCKHRLLHRGGPGERTVVRTVELLWARYSDDFVNGPGMQEGRVLDALRKVVDKSSLPAWWRAGKQQPPPEVLAQLARSHSTSVPGPLLVALVPPALVRNRLVVCANPGCTTLEGPSERDMPLPAVCGGCSAARYCRQECMEEHARDFDHTPRVCALLKEAAQAASAQK
ncbi:hypothetical protein HXX76_003948 [Chlamydomonas incerta]|uniref:MYND-type domain-containing protein n=1 Tax=Chlamydomonas incerta TaxID=51695 RepID=A0A835TLX1_CHLIN|nr:hypothetical protein HXX76_003948 [Chlamydomonas incerta]|eukprot:KAG2441096.1 hypothetical protein HXX76_003948 [Chlamydomonas incerta]